jgi:hypothetical protein
VNRSSSASHSTPEPKGDPRVVRGLGVMTRMLHPATRTRYSKDGYRRQTRAQASCVAIGQSSKADEELKKLGLTLSSSKDEHGQRVYRLA